MPGPQCQINDYEFASAIPGNLGIVKAQVVIWDHDPFYARPMQNSAFPFNKQVAVEEESDNKKTTVDFSLGNVSLAPEYTPDNMYVATIKKTGSETPGVPVGIDSFDFAGESAEVREFYPEGDKYEQDKFAHQLWIYCGSIFRNRPTLHPSEYDNAILNTETANKIKADLNSNTSGKWIYSLPDIQSAPKWIYGTTDDGKKRTFWPYQISKKSPNGQTPVHWSLRKHTHVWQGCDFFVHVKRGDKSLDEGNDNFPEQEIRDSQWERYKYLMYDLDDDASPQETWVDEQSNEAYFFKEEGDQPNDVFINPDGTKNKNDTRLRRAYWWANKSYILIEMGYDHELTGQGELGHNYIIEIVKGRHPRFIHLGKEIDHYGRATGVSGIYNSTDGWKEMMKSRVLSEYKVASGDTLLGAKEMRVAVKNHLGKLIITFMGYEDKPWIIGRKDRDISTNGLNKKREQIVVPNGELRIHGGNISAKLNFGYTRYAPETELRFDGISSEVKEASNNSVYLTMSHMGDIPKETPASGILDDPAIGYDNDPRIGPIDLTYDADAHTVREFIKNKPTDIPLYAKFFDQYKKRGKGWIASASGLTFEGLNEAGNSIGITKPHTIKIQNGDGNGEDKFSLDGLEGGVQACNPWREYAAEWKVKVKLTAGDVTMPSDEMLGGDPYPFHNVLTPIATQWRNIVTGGEKPVEGKLLPIDISALVTHMTDKWSADEYTTANHDMTIKCYLPLGAPTGLPIEGAEPNNLVAKANQLFALRDKAYYVTVKYWWDKGVGLRQSVNNALHGPFPSTPGVPPEQDDVLIQMTGIAFGGDLERSANKLYMNIKIKDYMEAMKKQNIFNSPFFDGVNDILSLYELAKLAGFDDTTKDEKYSDGNAPQIDRRPLGVLQHILDDPSATNSKYFYNGENIICRPYDLPSLYADLANPAVRFQTGETFESAIKKIAQLAGKFVYFDRWGVLRLENIPAYEVAFATENSANDIYTPVFEFVTSPRLVIPPGVGDDGGTAIDNGFVFDPTTDAARLVYNVVRYSRSVQDCINQIILTTASKDVFGEGTEAGVGGFIIEGHTFFEQIWNPESEGFLGFRKIFYQSNGVFGGLDQVRKSLAHYAKMKYPPTDVTFETAGIPGLKALDIITLDKELFYITEINHEITPNDNKWWMTITGEWFKPFRGDLGLMDQEEEKE